MIMMISSYSFVIFIYGNRACQAACTVYMTTNWRLFGWEWQQWIVYNIAIDHLYCQFLKLCHHHHRLIVILIITNHLHHQHYHHNHQSVHGNPLEAVWLRLGKSNHSRYHAPSHLTLQWHCKPVYTKVCHHRCILQEAVCNQLCCMNFLLYHKNKKYTFDNQCTMCQAQ